MDPTGSDDVKKNGVNKIRKQEKSESTGSILAGYKNHSKSNQILHFLLILLETFAKFSSNYLTNKA